MYAHAPRKAAAAESSTGRASHAPLGRGAPAGAPAFLGRGVQMQADVVQAWDCTDYEKPTCVQGEFEGAPVQAWDCTEYEKPTCVQGEFEGAPVQAMCAGCAAELDPVQAACATCEDPEPVQTMCAECSEEIAHPPEERVGAKLGGVQTKPGGPARSIGPAAVHRAARAGLSGANDTLPQRDRIQAAFGRHDVSDVNARIGGAAADASRAMGALAFTSGRSIAFRASPDLRLAAHEAAHVVQQRAGLDLPDQVGRPGDPWERHADAVAAAVVAGRSAEPLLDAVAPAGREATPEAAPAVQHAITSMPSHLQEEPPVLPPAPAAEAAAPAEEQGGEPVESAAPSPDAATEAAAEAPAEPEPEVEVGAAPAPAAAAAGGGGASCYSGPREEPPEDAEEPESDQKAAEPEEEDRVTFDAWPDTPDDCAAQAAAAQAAAAAPAEVAPVESAGGSAPADASMESTPEEGGGDPVEEAGESASEAPGGGEEASAASPADAMAGTIGGAVASREAAVADYDGATAELAMAGSAVPALSKGVELPSRRESAAAADRRRASEERIAAFFAGAAAQVEQALAFVASEVPARLGGMAEAAKANVQGAMETEKASISARVGQARELALAEAEMTRAEVTAAYFTMLEQVETETNTAITTLDDVHTSSVEAVETGETTGLADVNSRFQTGREDHEAKGPEYADLALGKGQTYVEGYESCKGDKSDDGFWDGCLTVRRAQAQQDAACKTAAGAEKGFLKAANKKGYDLLPLRGQYRCAVITGASQTVETLDKTHDQLVSGLETGRTATIGGLTSSYDAVLQGIDAALAGTLDALTVQENAQRQAVNDTGYLKQLAIDELAHTTAAGLARAVVGAVTSLQGTLDSLRTQLAGNEAPDPEAIGAALAAAQEGLGGGMGTLLDKMNEGATDAEGRIADLAGVTLEALTSITASNEEQTLAVETGLVTQMITLMSGAQASFDEIGGGHIAQAQQSATEGSASMETAVAGFEEALAGIGTRIDEALQSSLDQLTTDLNGQLAALDTQIPAEAQKAAEAEQPAWKSVVAIVLVILVIIAATVISIVTLGAGASLFAMIVVGALVGAASAALIQIINNWGAGKPWHEGVAQAAIMGAIGGALGALGGAAGGAIASGIANAGGSVLRQVVVTVGADLVSEGLTQVIGYVAFGQEFSWEGFVTAGVMSGVSFRPGARPGMPDVPRPSPGTRGAITQVAGGAAAGFVTEAGLAWASGREFNLNNAFSAAASGAASARASRLGGGGDTGANTRPAGGDTGATTRPAGGTHADPGGPTPRTSGADVDAPATPTRRTGWRGALDSFRSFDPGKMGERLNSRMDALGGRMSGVDPAATPRQGGPEAPNTRTDEPTTRTDEPTTRTDEPTTRTDEPTTRTDEPTTRTDQPDSPEEVRARTEAELEGTDLPARIGDEPHTFHFEEVDGRLRCTMCSHACGRVTAKLDALMTRTDLPEGLRAQLDGLKTRLGDLEADIANGRVTSEEAVQRLNGIVSEMQSAGRTHTSLGDDLNVDANALARTVRGETVGPSGKKWDDPTMTPEEFKADYVARHGENHGADLDAAWAAKQRLNPETGRLKNPNGGSDALDSFSDAQRRQLEARQAAATNGDKVVATLSGDTGVSWRDVLTPHQKRELVRMLREAGVPNAIGVATQLLVHLQGQGNIRVVKGTDAVRNAFRYGVTGLEVHHINPLYTGGGSDAPNLKNFSQTDPAHDVVHRWMEQVPITITNGTRVVNTTLQPTSLQNAMGDLLKPTVTTVRGGAGGGQVIHESLD